jgi:hypothetical protein
MRDIVQIGPVFIIKKQTDRERKRKSTHKMSIDCNLVVVICVN